MRRGPATVRSLVPHRLALTAVMLTALLAATLLSGLVSFAAIVTSYAVRATLASSPATSILITSSAGSAAAAAQDSARVAAVLHRALPGGPLTIEGSLGTDYLNIPAAVAGQHAQTHVISLPDPARRAALVAGTWPPRAAGGGAGTALPVAVPASTAARLRLHPGSTLALQVATTGRPIAVKVTGIFRRSLRASAFWTLDPAGSALPRTVGGFTIYPSLVASQAAITARGIPVSSASWAVGLDTGRIGTGSLAALASSLGPDLNGLGSSAGLRNVVVTTGLPTLLAGLEQAVVVARSQLAVGILILLVIAGATLALAVSLLSSQREAEAALLRARGASRRQLFRTGAAEALLLVAPAALLAPILGGLALPALTRRGPLAQSASPYPAAPPAAPPCDTDPRGVPRRGLAGGPGRGGGLRPGHHAELGERGPVAGTGPGPAGQAPRGRRGRTIRPGPGPGRPGGAGRLAARALPGPGHGGRGRFHRRRSHPGDRAGARAGRRRGADAAAAARGGADRRPGGRPRP